MVMPAVPSSSGVLSAATATLTFFSSANFRAKAFIAIVPYSSVSTGLRCLAQIRQTIVPNPAAAGPGTGKRGFPKAGDELIVRRIAPGQHDAAFQLDFADRGSGEAGS